MPWHLKVLLILLAVGVAAFVLLRPTVVQAGVADEDYRRRRNAWILVTLIVFLSHNFWVYAAVTAFAVWRYGRKDDNPMVLYALLLLAVPVAVRMDIPGIGPIEHFFRLDHQRILHLFVLLPFAVVLYRKGGKRPPLLVLCDRLILAYFAYRLGLQIVGDNIENITGLMRWTFYRVVDELLLYYVASRAVTSVMDFRAVLYAFVTAVAILAVVGIYETLVGWQMYGSLRRPLGLAPGTFAGHERLGGIRAEGTAGHSIPYGYVMVVGLGFFLYLAPTIREAWKRWGIGLVIAGGLVVSMSRGPWVGAAAMILVYAVLTPGMGNRLRTLAVAGVGGGAFLAFTPLGQRVFSLLPFIGTEAQENVSYRERLFEQSMLVFRENRLFGDLLFIENPHLEVLRQGQGLIDMVNSYLQVLLGGGLIGLALFLLMLIVPALKVWRVSRKLAGRDPEAERLGRVMVSVMAGIMVTIYTVSQISFVPTLYWLAVGLLAGYLHAFGHVLSESRQRARAGTAVRRIPRRAVRPTVQVRKF